jgi:hypothetical protein
MSKRPSRDHLEADGGPSYHDRFLDAGGPYSARARMQAAAVEAAAANPPATSNAGWLDQVDQQLEGRRDPKSAGSRRQVAEAAGYRWDDETGRNDPDWLRQATANVRPAVNPPATPPAPDPVGDAIRAHHRAEVEAMRAQQTKADDGWFGELQRRVERDVVREPTMSALHAATIRGAERLTARYEDGERVDLADEPRWVRA